MSKSSSYRRTRVSHSTHDFDPGNQLPDAHPFVTPSLEPDPSPTPEQIARMHQIDAGMMRTLNIQAKLAIAEPDDKYEQEADQVAAQVVDRLNSPQVQQKSIQRQASLEEEDELRMKPLAQAIQRQALPEEEDEELQMKPLAQRKVDGGGTASANLESSLEMARGQGQPLRDEVRSSMEQAFGADFSGVRVHTDSRSDGLNQSIQARAFTTGQDIFFRQGEYQPGNRGGQELLAHELTHVVQQNGGAVQQFGSADLNRRID